MLLNVFYHLVCKLYICLFFWLCNSTLKKKTFYVTGENKNPVIYVSTSGTKYTVLHHAAKYGRLNITIWYKDVLGFSDINPKDNKGNTPLYWATRKGHLDVVKYYIQNGYHASSKIFSKYSHQYAFKKISIIESLTPPDQSRKKFRNC